MILETRDRWRAQLTPENLAEIEALEPADWTVFLTGSQSGWVARVFVPGVGGAWSVVHGKHSPMTAIRQARSHSRLPSYAPVAPPEILRWRGCDVEVTG